MQLNSSLGEIKGVGPKTAEALAARGSLRALRLSERP